jgi:pyruvate dehydrogenase E1 component
MSSRSSLRRRLAAGLVAEDRRDARERGMSTPAAMWNAFWATSPLNCGLATVIDGHPATLAWLGSVIGHRTRPLGVEHFGETGSVGALCRHFGIDIEGILRAAQAVSAGKPIRYLRAVDR